MVAIGLTAQDAQGGWSRHCKGLRHAACKLFNCKMTRLNSS